MELNVKLPVSCGETSIVTETGIGRQYLGGSDLAPGPIKVSYSEPTEHPLSGLVTSITFSYKTKPWC